MYHFFKRIIIFSALALVFQANAASLSTGQTQKTRNRSASHRVTKKNTKKTVVKKIVTEQHHPHHWSGSSFSLGFGNTTGNTNDLNLSGAIKLLFQNGPWSNTFDLAGQFAKSNGVLTQEKYYGDNQLNYNFSKQRKNFVFWRAGFREDKFSPYDYQFQTAVGYGRDIVKTPNFVWSAQAGPGFRRNEIEGSQARVENHGIITTATNVWWAISKDCIFTQSINYDFGTPYDYMRTVTALTNKIIDNLAVQISYTMEYYSTIPPGSTNTRKLDTTTNVALVYRL